MRRFDARAVGYTTPVTSKKGVAGFGHPIHRCDASRSSFADSAASLFASPVLVTRWEARKGLPVRASGGRLTNPSSHRPRLVTGAVVFANHTAWRPFMAFTLTHTGARAPVVALPGAAPRPIPQSRLRGRYPRGVVSLAAWKRHKSTDRTSAWAQAHADYSAALGGEYCPDYVHDWDLQALMYYAATDDVLDFARARSMARMRSHFEALRG